MYSLRWEASSSVAFAVVCRFALLETPSIVVGVEGVVVAVVVAVDAVVVVAGSVYCRWWNCRWNSVVADA